MTDLEINKALAFAIGHTHLKAVFSLDGSRCSDICVFHSGSWRVFDHKDWATISPIAERYNLFPICASGLWFVHDPAFFELETSPQKSIAMAVIEKLNDKRIKSEPR